MEQTTADTDADAILMIGDRAMHQPDEPFVETWDLGEEWIKWTGLPFVFAMWVVRSDFDGPQIEKALCDARDLGVNSLEQIARRESSQLQLKEEAAIDYLYNNLHFKLGAAERHGLKLFYELAAKQGLVPDCLLYTSPSPRDATLSRMPSSA